jgi:hypothetical protein
VAHAMSNGTGDRTGRALPELDARSKYALPIEQRPGAADGRMRRKCCPLAGGGGPSPSLASPISLSMSDGAADNARYLKQAP